MKLKKFQTLSIIMIMMFTILATENVSSGQVIKGYISASCNKTYYKGGSVLFSSGCGSDWNGAYILGYYTARNGHVATRIHFGDLEYEVGWPRSTLVSVTLGGSSSVSGDYTTYHIIAGIIENGHSDYDNVIELYADYHGLVSYSRSESSFRFSNIEYYDYIIFRVSMTVGLYLGISGGGGCGPTMCPE
jgi:hypothetical protein